MGITNVVHSGTESTNVLSIPEIIQRLDLEPTKFKLVKDNGWSVERADAVETQYKGFLALAKLFPDDMHVPTVDIDEMWHTHILDTRKYMADCFAIFGSYLHHYPYLGLLGAEDKAEAEALFAVTKTRFSDMGVSLGAALDASDCGGGCSSSSCGSSSSCSSAPSGGDSPAPSGGDTPATPSSIWPVIASCGGSTPSGDDGRRREVPAPANRQQEKPKEKRRGWLPSLRIWGRSVDPRGFESGYRPDRDALLALAEQEAHTRILN